MYGAIYIWYKVKFTNLIMMGRALGRSWAVVVSLTRRHRGAIYINVYNVWQCIFPYYICSELQYYRVIYKLEFVIYISGLNLYTLKSTINIHNKYPQKSDNYWFLMYAPYFSGFNWGVRNRLRVFITDCDRFSNQKRYYITLNL